ncbi:glutathione S-transferase family protein [Roseococcus sp. SYP-B2431]|uniref:glutathione S-transferase family protein n=1 Tax=Roseococcus sp. SYP-B2431 TaxID=2496640 RepID=UPI00103F7E4C|nr:glutathione S-transferase family protein [Roseococcus sp. SYP-B2431]TCH96985.1 glutathione S-transferase family protein [Roseococcus sp. SYP-B2431]
MILYISPGSPFARIIRVLLRDRALPVEEVVVPLRDPASPLLEFSPAGRVPMLRDGADVLVEVPLILAHLGWLPADAPSRGRLGQALSLLEGIAVWNRDLRRPPEEQSPAFQALERSRATRILDGMNPDDHDPFAPEGVALACALGYCQRRHTVFRWREGRGTLAAWYDAAIARPAFQDTIPPLSGI